MKNRIIAAIFMFMLLVPCLSISSFAAVEYGNCTNCMTSSGDYRGYVHSYCVTPQESYTSSHRHYLLYACTITSYYRTTRLKCNYCGISRTAANKHSCYKEHSYNKEREWYCPCDNG